MTCLLKVYGSSYPLTADGDSPGLLKLCAGELQTCNIYKSNISTHKYAHVLCLLTKCKLIGGWQLHEILWLHNKFLPGFSCY